MLSPPTDSLYKFVAITGVAMVLWGAAFPWSKAYEAKLESVQVRGDIKAAGAIAAQLQVQIDELTAQLKDGQRVSEFDAEGIRARQRDLLLKLLEANRPADVGIEKLKVIDGANATYERLGWASVLVGSIFAVTGFVTWYIRVQRYVDESIRRQG